MEFFKGAAFGAFSGVLVSLVLSLVVAIAVMFIFTNDGWNLPAFRNVMILMPLIIGVWVVPIGVVLGLVNAMVRQAGRAGRVPGVPAGD